MRFPLPTPILARKVGMANSNQQRMDELIQNMQDKMQANRQKMLNDFQSVMQASRQTIGDAIAIVSTESFRAGMQSNSGPTLSEDSKQKIHEAWQNIHAFSEEGMYKVALLTQDLQKEDMQLFLEMQRIIANSLG